MTQSIFPLSGRLELSSQFSSYKKKKHLPNATTHIRKCWRFSLAHMNTKLSTLCHLLSKQNHCLFLYVVFFPNKK